MLPNLPPVLKKGISKLSPTAKLRLFGLAKIPLLFLIRPQVIKLDDTGCEIKVPLNKMTRNHVNSMYFGTLAIGADAVVAVFALYKSDAHPNRQVIPIFKNFKADFLKRAESDVVFRCAAGTQIEEMIKKAAETGERITEDIPIDAYTPDNNEVVATFTLGLSVKAKS